MPNLIAPVYQIARPHMHLEELTGNQEKGGDLRAEGSVPPFVTPRYGPDSIHVPEKTHSLSAERTAASPEEPAEEQQPEWEGRVLSIYPSAVPSGMTEADLQYFVLIHYGFTKL